MKIDIVDRDESFRAELKSILCKRLAGQFAGLEINDSASADASLGVLPPETKHLICIVESRQAKSVCFANESPENCLIILLPESTQSGCFISLQQEFNPAAILQKPFAFENLLQILENKLAGFAALTEKPDSAPLKAGDIDAIEAEIKALSLEYLRELPERFQELSGQISRLKSGDMSVLALAKNEAHKIKGTAASYGAHGVGEQLAFVDACLKEIVQQEQKQEEQIRADQHFWQKIEQALEKAHLLSRQALSELAPCEFLSLPLLRKQGRKVLLSFASDPGFIQEVQGLAAQSEQLLSFNFSDLEAALQLLELLNPELLLLELDLLTKEALDLCSLIRSYSGSKPRVLALVGAGLEERQSALSSGADDLVLKPVLGAELKIRLGLAP